MKGKKFIYPGYQSLFKKCWLDMINFRQRTKNNPKENQ